MSSYTAEQGVQLVEENGLERDSGEPMLERGIRVPAVARSKRSERQIPEGKIRA